MKDMKSMEFTPTPEPRKELESSSGVREILAAAALAGAAVSVPVAAQGQQPVTTEAATPENQTAVLSTRERVSESERLRLGEHFSLEQYTYTTLYQRLTNREVMFTDEQGIIIGEPVRLEPIVENRPGQVVTILPGALDARGVPIASISPSWLNAARTRLCATHNVPCNLQESLPRVRSTIRLVRDSERYLTPDTPRPETFLDIIQHMGSRPVAGEATTISHIDYVSTHFGENVDLPSSLESEIGRLLPGLTAQESQFNDRALSPVGARGMMQIMPDTQRRMGYGTTPLTFQRQVELSGQYFETAFTELSARNADDFAHITQEFFDGDTEAFNIYFLAPVLINSYNAGTTRLSRVVSWFRTTYPTRESISSITRNADTLNYDTFAAMAHFASINTTPETRGYKEHSSEYFSRVFALASIIEDNSSAPDTPAEGVPVTQSNSL